jgi:hypothetical protein
MSDKWTRTKEGRGIQPVHISPPITPNNPILFKKFISHKIIRSWILFLLLLKKKKKKKPSDAEWEDDA